MKAPRRNRLECRRIARLKQSPLDRRKRPCLTPDAEWDITLRGSLLTVNVHLPSEPRLRNEQSSALLLEVHDAVEEVLAPLFNSNP